jgi:NAD(P)H-hydrate epimerase
MILPLQDKGDGTLSIQAAGQVLDFTKERANVLAVGPGLSNDDEIEKLVCTLITESQIPVVVDADGINAIVNKVHILKKSRAPVIITPHPGEMSRLLSKSRDFRELDTGGIRSVIEQNRIETAVAFSGKTGTYLVLKGVPTVTAVPDGRVYINSTGNPGMATAGAGDVLTGMISSFLAQRLSPEIASVLGVYMHGAAGDVAACRSGERVLTASDIIKLTPQAFKSIKL